MPDDDLPPVCSEQLQQPISVLQPFYTIGLIADRVAVIVVVAVVCVVKQFRFPVLAVCLTRMLHGGLHPISWRRVPSPVASRSKGLSFVLTRAQCGDRPPMALYSSPFRFTSENSWRPSYLACLIIFSAILLAMIGC